MKFLDWDSIAYLGKVKSDIDACKAKEECLNRILQLQCDLKTSQNIQTVGDQNTLVVDQLRHNEAACSRTPLRDFDRTGNALFDKISACIKSKL